MIDRGPDGYPKLKPPDPGKSPSRREVHRNRCYLLGITDPAAVEQLWKDQEAKLGAAREGGRRGRRKRPGGD